MLCKTCNEKRTKDYFKASNTNNGRILYNTSRCKICIGAGLKKNYTNKYLHIPKLRNKEYDKRKLYLTLKRLEITKGMATEIDKINILELYKQIFKTAPIFIDVNELYIYMYQKLKEFSDGTLKVKRKYIKSK